MIRFHPSAVMILPGLRGGIGSTKEASSPCDLRERGAGAGAIGAFTLTGVGAGGVFLTLDFLGAALLGAAFGAGLGWGLGFFLKNREIINVTYR